MMTVKWLQQSDSSFRISSGIAASQYKSSQTLKLVHGLQGGAAGKNTAAAFVEAGPLAFSFYCLLATGFLRLS